MPHTHTHTTSSCPVVLNGKRAITTLSRLRTSCNTKPFPLVPRIPTRSWYLQIFSFLNYSWWGNLASPFSILGISSEKVFSSLSVVRPVSRHGPASWGPAAKQVITFYVLIWAINSPGTCHLLTILKFQNFSYRSSGLFAYHF